MSADRTPIRPSEIRAGDTIREEYAEPWHTDGGIPRLAIEYTATPNLKTICRRKATGWFLLNRPTPPVELPTEPTLGWATFRVDSGESEVCLSMWSGPRMRPACEHGGAAGGDPEYVTAFTPATAVPTDALEVLREHQARFPAECPSAVPAFLAAVDEANGATA